MTTPTSPSITASACTKSAFPELTPLIQPESASVLSTLLASNHASHHCFFNTRGMHNHSLHQLVADLTLSASPSQLERHYQYQKSHYLDSFSYNNRSKYDPFLADTTGSGKGGQPIEKVDERNWKSHLGDARAYWSYLHFFDREVERLGFRQVLDTYVFSHEANQGEAKMVVRFYGGVLHALIHVGYGLEFGVAAIGAEGLAMATATAAGHAWLFDHAWLSNHTSGTGEGGKGLLELMPQGQRDERLSVSSLQLDHQDSSLPDKPFQEGPAAGVIQAYVDQWAAIDTGDFEDAMTDLALVSALLIGAVPRQDDGKAYKHDFFLMHLNNAHLFTSLYLDLFSDSPRLQKMFLRALLAQFLFYYISRGRPSFTTSNLILEHSASSGVSWEQMFSEARENVDEHLPKAIRALYVYERRYGHSQTKLLQSGLLTGDKWQGESSIWFYTATQLVRMHRGQLQRSKHDSEDERAKGESVGSHQEFWSFDPFF